MKLSTAVNEFLIANEADGIKATTNNWYRSLLKHFTDAYPDKDLEEVTTKQVRRYLINIRRQFDSEDTVNAHMRALHRFWRWCGQEYEIKSPMRNIRYPSQPKQFRPKAIETTDIVKLFEAAGKADDPDQAVRDRAIIALLVDTGIRAAGVVRLNVTDLDFDKRRAVVLEKGDKVRSVPFSPYTGELINRWIKIKRPNRQLFYNMRTYKRLTVSGLYQILKRLKTKADLPGRANPHAFRHAFAREYLRSGGDLATLSRLMGHEDISTTASYYAVFTENEVSEEHQEHSQIRHLLDNSNDKLDSE